MNLASTSHAVKVRDIQTLVMSFHPVIVIETVEEERVQALLQAATQEMNLTLLDWSIAQGLVKSPDPQSRYVDECAPAGSHRPTPYEDSTEPLQVLKIIQGLNLRGVYWLKDFTVHLSDAELARHLRELVQQFSQTRSALVITGEKVQLPPEIAHAAVFYDLKLPGRGELYQAVQEVLRTLRAKNRIQVEVTEAEMPTIVQALMGMTLKQARQAIAYAVLEDGKLDMQDVGKLLDRKAQMIRAGGVLEYFPVDHKPVNLAGFAGLKRWLSQAKMGFTPQAQALNLPAPKGILIVGIQGCGKSLAAKTISQAWGMPLLKLDAGRLYDKFVGESEKNFRQAVDLAESMAPAVLWIDEIEKSFTTGPGGDSDGGLSQRLFGSLLTWMQEKSQEVFVVATANDLSQVPPELLRKGRFDEVFFVDLPNPPERGGILQTHLLQRHQVPRDFDFPVLVNAMDGFSGAEIEQAVIAALYRSLYETRSLDTALLLETVKGMIPLSVARREDVQRLRAIAQERFVSVR